MDKWVLIATCEQGAKVFKSGRTRKETLYLFDNIYVRSGWKIQIGRNDCNIPMQIIKSTYR